MRKSRAEKELFHRWITCPGKIVISGAGKKRKVDERVEKEKKKAKVAAVGGSLASRISAPGAGGIYEPDSEEEKEMDFGLEPVGSRRR